MAIGVNGCKHCGLSSEVIGAEIGGGSSGGVGERIEGRQSDVAAVITPSWREDRAATCGLTAHGAGR